MVGDVGIIAVAVMRINKLRGLTALTSDRRNKYRPSKCNGERTLRVQASEGSSAAKQRTGRLGLAHKQSQTNK